MLATVAFRRLTMFSTGRYYVMEKRNYIVVQVSRKAREKLSSTGFIRYWKKVRSPVRI